FTYDGANWDLTVAGNGTAATDITPALLTSTYGLTLSSDAASSNTIIIAIDNTYKLDADWMYKTTLIDSKYWYYAVSWNMTFSYDFGADETDRHVYFNVDRSAATTTGDDATLETIKGFRLAFHNGTSRNLIWAPAQTDVNDIHYVSSTSVVSNYSENDKLNVWYSGKGSTYRVAEGGSYVAPTASAGNNYLCELTKGGGNVTINCVAWFEGSDPNIVNSARMDTVAASLSFFCVAES
ncbi:MAG: hypothetical protein K6F32_02475, partial [Bacilli bacterium]|nr:hypothetical protein [Bacilli bacterium]